MERETLQSRYLPYVLAREYVYKRISDGSSSILLDRVWDYLREFGEGEAGLAQVALEKLLELGVPEDIAAVILSICPRTKGELLSIYQMRRDWSPGDDHFDNVLEAIRDFCATTPFYQDSGE